MLGDWLVVSQVLPVNPAAAVRGPKHVVTTGATPVLSPAEARRLLAAIDTGTLAGRRDRALVSVMLYSFARVSAVIGMRRQDYFRQERQGWLRLHEKGGKRHDVPAHHRAAEALDKYVEAAGRARGADGDALPERGAGWAAADGPGALAASRPGDDQAAGGGGGSPALDLLPHVPGDGDHGVSVEWGDARTRAVDRRARLPEDDEALRSDGGHDHRRRDRAHRDLGGGRPARRRSRATAVRRVGTDARPEAASATSGVVWRGRSIRSCVFASFPLGAGGARPRVEGAPRPPGSVRAGRTPGASAQQDPWSGGPACPGPGFARLDRMERRYAWLRRACGSRSRDLEPRRSRWRGGAVRATATCAVGILRLIG